MNSGAPTRPRPMMPYSLLSIRLWLGFLLSLVLISATSVALVAMVHGGDEGSVVARLDGFLAEHSSLLGTFAIFVMVYLAVHLPMCPPDEEDLNGGRNAGDMMTRLLLFMFWYFAVMVLMMSALRRFGPDLGLGGLDDFGYDVAQMIAVILGATFFSALYILDSRRVRREISDGDSGRVPDQESSQR